MDMEYWFNRVIVILRSVFLFFLALITPMKSAIEVLVVVATFDFVAGIAGNVWTGKEEFRIGKAFGSLYKIIAYLMLVILAHFCAYNLGEADAAWLVVKYITILVVYWYFVNILSNMIKAFPRSTGITFLYLLVSMKILPLLLSEMGIGGKDLQELAEEARKTVKRSENKNEEVKNEENK